MAMLDRRFLDHAMEIENPALVAAMYAVVEQDTAKNRQALYQALIKSTLIVPTAESMSASPVPERQTLSDGTTLQLLAFENAEGDTVLLVFTDEPAALAWMPDGTPYVALDATDLFTLATRSQIAEVVINPAGPVSGRVLHNEFMYLAEGQLPVFESETATEIPAGTMVLISSPDTMPPDAWLDGLREVMAQQSQIKQAYVFQLSAEQTEPQLVVGVRFETSTEKSEQDRIMQTILSNFAKTQEEDATINFVVLESGDFLQTIRDTVAPFYAREGA